MDDLLKFCLCLFNFVGQDEKSKGVVNLGMKIFLWKMERKKGVKFIFSYVYGCIGDYVLI